MPLSKPIVFCLYDMNDEVISTHSKARITTNFLERAIELAGVMSETSPAKDVLGALDQLIVDFYGGQFSLEQIREGGDISEKMAVLQAILSRAADFTPPGTSGENPTKPKV
jgi:hypothetical protein